MDVLWLEQKGLVRIILYLLDNPGSQKVDFRKKIGLDSQNAMKVFDILWDDGYLESVPHKRKLLFKLSEKGEYIARLLKEVVEETGKYQGIERIVREGGEFKVIFTEGEGD